GPPFLFPAQRALDRRNTASAGRRYFPFWRLAGPPFLSTVGLAIRAAPRRATDGRRPFFLASMPRFPIKMPQLGESIAEATIREILVSPGEEVKADQNLFEVETDKAM